ncbi:MAG: DUF1294 domain-containing protein [Lachnospiraceae bacterium]|nr:DUF1294 domain-containing protein [Lachnospiraceae bacterium]
MSTGIKAFLIAYVLINLAVFAFYGIDKAKAVRNEWRISEKSLMTAALFGAPGALIAMFVFRHKIRKPKFYIGVPVILIAEAALAIFIFTKTAG